MKAEIVDISLMSMIVVYFLAFILFLILKKIKSGNEKNFLKALTRMSVQLIIVGYVLKYIFAVNSLIIIIIIYLFMSSFATYTIVSKVNFKIKHQFAIVFFPIFLIGLLLTIFFLLFIAKTSPWYDARYFIPIAGMVLGNSMNACALSIERLVSEIKTNILKIETLISVGATPFESVSDEIFKSIRAASLPIITNMSGIGVVFLPGLMTGQILSGTDPIISIKYQIAIMICIVSSLSFSSIAIIFLTYKNFFTIRGQLKKEIIDEQGI
ncbi:iron export ABC transporter permease subunit FetB [Deferribacteraceae bacterium V6Fe1]|nr:iron export ABC transporter permease subunit FetB [Deferribacteraceae bacterium V6Fe1]